MHVPVLSRAPAVAALLATLLPVAAVAGGPRIVSINPCVDAILVQVADPAQIAGISHYSQDPQATSMPLEVAARFQATSGTAEEILVLRPELVLSGPLVWPATGLALARLGVPVETYAVPRTLAEGIGQVRTIARLAGHPERGERLASQIEAALAAARAPDDRRVTALIWQGGGMVPGRGTLADELLGLAGFANMSTAYGLGSWDILSLERFLAVPPRVVLSMSPAERAADRMLGHPALRHLPADVAFREFPFRLLGCAGPNLIEAAARLAAIRSELVAR